MFLWGFSQKQVPNFFYIHNIKWNIQKIWWEVISEILVTMQFSMSQMRKRKCHYYSRREAFECLLPSVNRFFTAQNKSAIEIHCELRSVCIHMQCVWYVCKGSAQLAMSFSSRFVLCSKKPNDTAKLHNAVHTWVCGVYGRCVKCQHNLRRVSSADLFCEVKNRMTLRNSTSQHTLNCAGV